VYIVVVFDLGGKLVKFGVLEGVDQAQGM